MPIVQLKFTFALCPYRTKLSLHCEKFSCVGRVCLLKSRIILFKNDTGNNGTNRKVGRYEVQDVGIVWANLTPVCDFYLKLEQVLLVH